MPRPARILYQVVVNLLNGIPREHLGVESLAQQQGDFRVGLRLALDIKAGDGRHCASTGAFRNHARLLNAHSNRQRDIGKSLDGRGDAPIANADKLQLLQNRVNTVQVGIGHAAQWIGAHHDSTGEAVRLLSLRLDNSQVGLIQNHAHGNEGVLIDTDNHLLHVFGELFEAPREVMEVIGLGCKDLSTRLVDVAANSQNRNDGTDGANTVALHVNRQAKLNGCVLCCCNHTRSLLDLLRINPCALAELIKVILASALNEGIETIGPAINEIVVVQVFLDDNLKHCHGNSRVNGRTGLNPQVCTGGHPSQTRIDDDHLRATLLDLNNPLAEEAIGIGRNAVVAPNNNHFRVLVLGIVVTVLMAFGAVRHHIAAGAYVIRHQTGHPAGQARRIALNMRGTHRIGKALRLPQNVTTGAAERLKGMPAVLLAKFGHGVVNQVDSLVPRNTLPRIAVATLAGIALHWIKQTLLAVDNVRKSSTTRADMTLVVRMLGIAFDLNELAIFDVAKNAAAAMAARSRPSSGSSYGIAVLFPSGWQVLSATH